MSEKPETAGGLFTRTPLPKGSNLDCQGSKCDGCAWAAVKLKIGRTATKRMCNRCADMAINAERRRVGMLL